MVQIFSLVTLDISDMNMYYVLYINKTEIESVSLANRSWKSKQVDYIGLCEVHI